MNNLDLLEQMDQISIALYQNREEESINMIRLFLDTVKKFTEELLKESSKNAQAGQLVYIFTLLRQELCVAYEHYDMLAMADCLQKYASFISELNV